MRHYWVDRVPEIEPGVRAAGLKAVALSEDSFTDHFPGNPVLPGVHLLEGLAQTAGVLLHATTHGARIAVMASIDRARFVSFARPGDLVRLEVEIESRDADAARVFGRARAGEREVAVARFTFRLLEPDTFIPEAFRPFWEGAMATWRGEYPGGER
jgi:3-hydroxyacyl-[acyl-carrier-protein] dehydratase